MNIQKTIELYSKRLVNWRLARGVICGITLSSSATLFAQQVQVILDPARTKIEWTLGDVLHTVHGTFKLKSGNIFTIPTPVTQAVKSW